MAKGKQTCKILKEIRKQIAAENDIEFVTSECTYKGDCKGTCPKCEAEVRYLECELEKRQRMGKAAVFAGMSLGTLFAATSCDHPIPRPTEGEPCVPDSTEMQNSVDTISNDTLMLEGDVLAPVPDTMKAAEKRPACKLDVDLVIPGDIVEDGEVLEEREPLEGSIDEWVKEGEPYEIVDQMPEFPGGEEALKQYIKDNARFGDVFKEYQCDVAGKIFVGFVVESDGSITNVRVLRGVEKHFDEEAVRVISSMPQWKPGMLKGEPVSVRYMVPVAIPQLQ